MNVLLSNVFYDPSSPWYYIIGVIFLVLIFGALTAYILLSKKFGKDNNKEPDGADTENGTETKSANVDVGADSSVSAESPADNGSSDK